MNKERAIVFVSGRALAKSNALVAYSKNEVAWHYVMHRGRKPDTYHIDDVLVYPQLVSAATVDTDQQAYQDWLMALPDEVFSRVRGQAHSHVRMPVFPSSTDSRNQEELLSTLGDEDFYFFEITNKYRDTWACLIDHKTHKVFESEQISFVCLDEDAPDYWRSVKGFLKEERSIHNGSHEVV